MTHFSIVIVIVNWNAGTQLEDCLISIAKADSPGVLSVVVVDNDSNDGSEVCVERMAAEGHDMMLVRSGRNLGFGNACNLGVERFLTTGRQADFVLFLNPDTMLKQDTLTVLCAAPQIVDPEFAIFGAQLEDETGVSHSCSNFPTALNFWCKYTGLHRMLHSQDWAQHHMTNFDHRSSREVEQVMGAFLMIRLPLFQQFGGFDPQFFVYFEEVDLCLRAHQAGYRVWFEACARAWHRGGGTTEGVKGFRLYLSLSSRLRYFLKNRSFWEYVSILALSFVVEPVARFVRLILRGRMREMGSLLEGYWMFLTHGGAR